MLGPTATIVRGQAQTLAPTATLVRGQARTLAPTAMLVVSLFSPVSTSQKRTAESRAQGHSPNYSRVRASMEQRSGKHFANSVKSAVKMYGSRNPHHSRSSEPLLWGSYQKNKYAQD